MCRRTSSAIPMPVAASSATAVSIDSFEIDSNPPPSGRAPHRIVDHGSSGPAFQPHPEDLRESRLRALLEDLHAATLLEGGMLRMVPCSIQLR